MGLTWSLTPRYGSGCSWYHSRFLRSTLALRLLTFWRLLRLYIDSACDAAETWNERLSGRGGRERSGRARTTSRKRGLPDARAGAGEQTQAEADEDGPATAHEKDDGLDDERTIDRRRDMVERRGGLLGVGGGEGRRKRWWAEGKASRRPGEGARPARKEIRLERLRRRFGPAAVHRVVALGRTHSQQKCSQTNGWWALFYMDYNGWG